MARGIPSVNLELDQRIEALGFELVELEWAGSKARPILRIRVDRPDSAVGESITVDECAKVSRGLEPWLDELSEVPDRYVLEVSSPGVDRPLTRERDWTRFAGENVVVKGKVALAGDQKRIEGELLGVEGEAGALSVLLRLESGEEVRFGLEDVERARLLFRWG